MSEMSEIISLIMHERDRISLNIGKTISIGIILNNAQECSC